jgi:hypothetical protein
LPILANVAAFMMYQGASDHGRGLHILEEWFVVRPPTEGPDMSDDPEKVWVLYIRSDDGGDRVTVWSSEERANAAILRYVRQLDAEAMADDLATVMEYFENADEHFEIRPEVIDGGW